MVDSEEVLVDVRGQTCPMPLIAFRRAVRNAGPGTIIRVIGDHEPSKKEIPMACSNMGHTLLGVQDEDPGGMWVIRVQVKERRS
jgi:tRNA 2-thiouridine synthesizing protein A